MVNIERIIKWVITIKSRITFNLGIFVCIKSRQQVILFLDVYFSFKLLLILNKSIQEFLENTKSKTIMTDNEIYAWLIYLPWTMRLLLCETWVKLVFLPLLKKKKKTYSLCPFYPKRVRYIHVWWKEHSDRKDTYIQWLQPGSYWFRICFWLD